MNDRKIDFDLNDLESCLLDLKDSMNGSFKKPVREKTVKQEVARPRQELPVKNKTGKLNDVEIDVYFGVEFDG